MKHLLLLAMLCTVAVAGSASAESTPLALSAASARCVRRGACAEAMAAGAAGVAPRHSGVAAINS